MSVSPKTSRFLKIGIALFCFMCLFFATNMASKYEHQKSETDVYRNKVKELEEKIQELTNTNRELLQIRSALVQEKEQLAKEIHSLQEKHSETEDWKLAITKEKETLIGDLITKNKLIEDLMKRLTLSESAAQAYPLPPASNDQSMTVEEETPLATQDNTPAFKKLEETQEISPDR